MTRSEFEEAAMGKSAEELVDTFGEPDEVFTFTLLDPSESPLAFQYNEITRDSAGNVDPRAVAIISSSKREVAKVFFY